MNAGQEIEFAAVVKIMNGPSAGECPVICTYK